MPNEKLGHVIKSIRHVLPLFQPSGEKSARLAEQNVAKIYNLEKSKLEVIESYLKVIDY